MNQSESIVELSKAFCNFQKQVEGIKKDSKNPFFNSTYASLGTILNSIRQPLFDNGLSITQFPEGQNGLTTRLMHSSGEWLEASYTMTPSKNDPQGQGSVITYMRRYSLAGILGLNTDVDDDGNYASNNSSMQSIDTKPKPFLNETDTVFATVVDALKSGKRTIDDVKKAYRMTNDVEKKLKSI